MNSLSGINKITPEKEKQQKRQVVVIFFILMLIQGISIVVLKESEQLSSLFRGIIGPIIVAISISWSSVDSRARGEVLNVGWIIGFLLLAPILFPFYLYGKYGLKRGMILTLKSVVVVFIALLISVFSEVITEYILNV